jgi:NADH:ubiquinone oxidoreductase subunit E
VTAADLTAVDEILERHPQVTGNVIAILHDVQSRYGWLPEPVLRHLSGKTGVPITRLYGIASFYHFLSLKPKGRHQLHVCLGTACHVKGGARILDDLERRLGIEAGETTPDMRYSLDEVRCVGACSFAPVVVVDQSTHGEMTPKRLADLLKKQR